MTTISNSLVALTALSQLWCLILEMFLWQTPIGAGNFGISQEFAHASARLAANKSLYNGFLAVGLVWSLFAASFGFELKIFFLLCALVAGLHCAATVSRRFLYVQAAPAALALATVVALGR